jgi:sensor domain CHASE-containing protein
MIGLTPWHVVITLAILLIIIAVIAFALVMIIQFALGGRRPGSSAVHADLIRINERLTAIEKTLRDIR